MTDRVDYLKRLNNACFVDGQWLNDSNGNTIDVINPFDGSLVGRVPSLSDQHIQRAIDSAHHAKTDWATLTAHQRGDMLDAWADLIEQNKSDLAYLMTLESGKPIKESEGEMDYAISFVKFFAQEAKRVYGDVIPTTKDGLRYVVIKQPIGVCAAITPWNFPAAMITRKVAPALAAGCPIIVKPASQTPFSALALADLADQAGFPKGVLQVVTGDAKQIATLLCQSPIIQKLSFTGSTQTGKILMAQCADTVKKLSLELGGNAPFIVFEDADLTKAVDGLVASKYRNAGQTCVCANRIYLHTTIKEEFLRQYTQKVSNLVVTNPLDPACDIGSLINHDALKNTQALIKDALEKGATLILGGKPADSGDCSFLPTIITDLKETMQMAQQEIFAPISAIYEFDDEQEVIQRANDTPFGLAAYFYTQNLSRSWRVMGGLDYGMVGQNTGLISNAVAPFGGIKQSGFGREGSKYGIDEYLSLKYWCVDVH